MCSHVLGVVALCFRIRSRPDQASEDGACLRPVKNDMVLTAEEEATGQAINQSRAVLPNSARGVFPIAW